MTREDIIRMAREANILEPMGFDNPNMAQWRDDIVRELERFAALVAAAERAAMMQLFTDPENQPTQHGTVTVEYMQREVAAEREACAKVCEELGSATNGIYERNHECAAAIRARGQA